MTRVRSPEPTIKQFAEVHESIHPLDSPTPAGEGWQHSMIAEAAYYRAEKRGFASGMELEDWLAAEKEIESLSRAAV
jgi:hypothetical protein